MPTTMNRRAILAGAASLPAISVPAFAKSTDPVFAAIEAHRLAWAQFEVTTRQQSVLEETVPPERRQTRLHQSIIVDTDDPRWIVAERTSGAALERVGEAERALIGITPTSIPGVITLLGYVADHAEKTVDAWENEHLNSVVAHCAAALRASISSSASGVQDGFKV
jgi:hypothetical protein